MLVCDDLAKARAVLGLLSYVLYFTVLPLLGVWAWNALLPFWAQAGWQVPAAGYREMWLMMLLAWLLLH